MSNYQDIRNILNRIDGVNAPVQEEAVTDGKILSMISDLRDAIIEHPDMADDQKTAVY